MIHLVITLQRYNKKARLQNSPPFLLFPHRITEYYFNNEPHELHEFLVPFVPIRSIRPNFSCQQITYISRIYSLPLPRRLRIVLSVELYSITLSYIDKRACFCSLREV